jgi:ubiquinone/menaquinone biosynthesis C-methylase UbiE
MDHFNRIYSTQAAGYQRMISAEDVDGNLLPAILDQVSLAGRVVLDLGTGTGRLPIQCRTESARFVALDRQIAMLVEQQRLRDELGGRWPLVLGDMDRLPFKAGSFDVLMAGWALGHATEWYPESWLTRIAGVIGEMQRVLRRPGALIILETMGTGALQPAPPAPALAEYYAWLEQQAGFAHTVIQTDYQFSSVEDAEQQMSFFFGPEMGALVRRNNWSRVPEWTGMWIRNYE